MELRSRKISRINTIKSRNIRKSAFKKPAASSYDQTTRRQNTDKLTINRLQENPVTGNGVGNHQTDPLKSSSCRSLVECPPIVSTFDCDWHLPKIVCVESGLAWVRTGVGKVELVDRQGSAREKVETDFVFEDMDVTNDGKILFTRHDEKCIMVGSPEMRTEILFTTDMEPRGICSLNNEEILITFHEEGRVLIYNKNGEITRELDKHLFKYPFRAFINKVSQECYIIDSIGKLLIFDDNLELKLVYTGTQEEPFISGSGVPPFGPGGVSSDNFGNIFVTNYSNYRVHILDQDCRTNRYLVSFGDTDDNPFGVSVDNEGHVWTGSRVTLGVGRIRVYKYLT